MGAFSKHEPIKISGRPGWEPHEYVVIKGNFTAGDKDYVAAKATGTASKDGKNAEVSIPVSNTVRVMQRMIIEWHLTDGNNSLVPLTVENIAELPVSYSEPIMDAIDEIAKKGSLTASEQENFTKGASQPTSKS